MFIEVLMYILYGVAFVVGGTIGLLWFVIHIVEAIDEHRQARKLAATDK